MSKPITRLLLAAAVAAVFSPSPARAAVSCAYAAASHTVSVSATANFDALTLVRSGSAISVNGAACGGATVANTDTVAVTGAAGRQTLQVDLSGGPLAPGYTAESVGASEIEIDVNLSAGTDTLAVHGGAGGDVITFGSAGASVNGDTDVDVTFAAVERLTASGRAGADKLSGAGGFGTAAASTGDLALYGDDGGDTIRGGDGDDSLDGGADADTILGGPGDDRLSGWYGADKLQGGPGEDNLEGGPDNDVIEGGDGNDFFYPLGVDGEDLMVGGAGRDMASYASRTDGLALSLDGVANDGSAAEHDNLEPDIEDLEGGAGPDVITASATSNRLVGYAGSDTLKGLDGDDVLIAGEPWWAASESALNVLDGGPGTDQLYGSGGNDQLSGGDGSDALYSSPGNDLENGGAGRDWFDAGWEPDGADRLFGGPGADFVSYWYRMYAVKVSLDGIANDGLAGAEGDNVYPDVEGMSGGYGDDRLTGSPAVNSIRGGPGADTILAGDGGDGVSGGDGNDLIVGGDGEDWLFGENGDDSFKSQDGGWDQVDGGADTDTVLSKDSFDSIFDVP